MIVDAESDLSVAALLEAPAVVRGTFKFHTNKNVCKDVLDACLDQSEATEDKLKCKI